MRYRRKHLETVDAFKFDGTGQAHADAENWALDLLQEGRAHRPNDSTPGSSVFTGDCNGLYIDTLNSFVRVSPGDYIVVNMFGEFEKWTSATFRRTYAPMIHAPGSARVISEATPVHEAQVPDEGSGITSAPEDVGESPGVAGVPVREAQQTDVAPDETDVTNIQALDAAHRVEKILEKMHPATPFRGVDRNGEIYQLAAPDLRQLVYATRQWQETKRQSEVLTQVIARLVTAEEESFDD